MNEHELLGLFPRLTVRRDEIKCWVVDRDEGGTRDTYLSVADLGRLSKTFGKIAKRMKKAE